MNIDEVFEQLEKRSAEFEKALIELITACICLGVCIGLLIGAILFVTT